MQTSAMILAISLLGLACTRVPANAPESRGSEPARAPSVIVEKPEAPACTARMPRGAPLLIPNAAEWVVHVGPRALMQSRAFELIAPKLEQSAEWVKAKNEILRPCAVELAHIDHVIVGFNAAEEFVAVLTAPGIGRPDVARCVMIQMNPEQFDLEIKPLPSDPSIPVIEFAKGRAFLFGDDMLALASTSWADEVVELSACLGAPAVRSSFARPLSRLDLNAPVWFAAKPIPASMTAVGDPFGFSMSSWSSFAVSMHFNEGASIQSVVQTQDSLSATKTATGLQGMMTLMAGSMPPELSNLPSRIVVGSVDDDVHLTITLTYDELRFIAGSM